MNLGTLRTRVFEQADWQPGQSTEAKTRVNTFINRAIEQIALEAPQLFFTEECSLRLQPDVESANDDDTVSVDSVDSWVIQRDLTSTGTGYSAWRKDGRWDGRWIAITLSTGEILYRQIREIWETTVQAGVFRQFASLMEPWPDGVAGSTLKWRIYTPRYPLPPDTIRIRHARLRKYGESTFDNPLQVIGEVQAEDALFSAQPGSTLTGSPDYIYRRGFFQIDGPKDAATVELDSNTPWLGPEPPGQFEFVFTYVWGVKYDQFPGPESYATGATGRQEPLFESAPSPVSSTVTSSTTSGAIVITTPNIDFEQGFGFETDLDGNTLKRYQHSGFRKRIYVRRKSADFTNYSTLANDQPGLSKIDVIDDYFLLHEIDGSTQAYSWRGSVSPDRLKRLKDVAGYQMIEFWPRPSQEDTVLLNIVRRPQPLADDQDAPRIVPEAGDLIVQLAGAFLAEHDGRHDIAQMKRDWYQKFLRIVADQVGDLRPNNRPIYRKAAKARKGANAYRNWPAEIDFDG